MLAEHPGWWVLFAVLTCFSFIYGYVGYPAARTSGARARKRFANALAAGGLILVLLADAPFKVILPFSILFGYGGYRVLRYLEGPERY